MGGDSSKVPKIPEDIDAEMPDNIIIPQWAKKSSDGNPKVWLDIEIGDQRVGRVDILLMKVSLWRVY